ncbi:hypothetical protein J6590_066391 [Homalodisca vitripennis]|nr:hypothetical protein J6590_066391 [Homalodisca vitripennis]
MEDRAKSHWTIFVVYFIPDHEFFVRSELAPTVRPLSGLQKRPARRASANREEGSIHVCSAVLHHPPTNTLAE